MLAGAIDVWRVATSQNGPQVFSSSGIAFAKTLHDATPANALILHAPAHNHPALLSGRRLFSGYNGHLWSHGLDYESRVRDVKRIYAGEPEAPALLTKYGITHVLVGPMEYQSADIRPNGVYWERYPVTFESEGYRVYRVR